MALGEQAAVTDWPLRLLLTAATLAVIAVALLALRRGWRRRGQRQAWAALPTVPSEVRQSAGRTGGIVGKYVGTVRAGDWLDRIVAGGAMARTTVQSTTAGLLLQRQGEVPLFVPGADIRAVGTAPGMLQKVFGRHGIVTVTWNWGGAEVVSGIWFTDPADQRTVIGWAARWADANRDSGTARVAQSQQNDLAAQPEQKDLAAQPEQKDLVAQPEQKDLVAQPEQKEGSR